MGESGGGGDGTWESVSQWAEEISSQKRQQGLRTSEGHTPPRLNSWSVLTDTGALGRAWKCVQDALLKKAIHVERDLGKRVECKTGEGALKVVTVDM